MAYESQSDSSLKVLLENLVWILPLAGVEQIVGSLVYIPYSSWRLGVGLMVLSLALRSVTRRWDSFQGYIANLPRLKIVRPRSQHGQTIDLASGWELVVSQTPGLIRFLLKNVGLPRMVGHTTCFVTAPIGRTTVAIEPPCPVQFTLGVYFTYPRDFGPDAFEPITGSYHVRWETRMKLSDDPIVLYDGSVDLVVTPPVTQTQVP